MKNTGHTAEGKRVRCRGILSKMNKAVTAVAFVHWIVSFLTDHIVFEYVMWDFSDVTQMIKTAMTYGAKAVFLLVLIGIYHGLYYFFTKADKGFVRYTLIYFGINMLLLVLCWPGIWRMDEFGIFNSAVKLLPVFWQNYLTSLFYVFSLMLIPIPSGVIIVQCALISLMAGYIIRFFVRQFGKGGLLAFVPCLFFPVLDSNLYPMRMSLYGFMELFLLVYLWEVAAGRSAEPDSDGDGERRGNFGFLCILAALITVWRTEAVYYFILFPILLVILFGKKPDKKKLCRVICGYLVCALCLFLPQQAGDKLTSGNQYDLTSVVLPLVPLVNEAYGRTDCQEELTAIDKVIDVELAVTGAKEGKNGISLFWSEPDFQRSYTDAEYRAFKNAYYALVCKFPKVFLTERWDCFLHSVDLLGNTTELFEAEGVANYDTFRAYPATQPVGEELRNSVIRILEWRSSDYDNKKAGYGLIYTAIVPICMILAVWAYCLVRRKWKGFFLLSLPLCKLPLIFLTAPSRLFMYYYSLYLIGYFLLIFVLLAAGIKGWKKCLAPVRKTIAYAKRNGGKEAWYAVLERIDHTHTDAQSRFAAAYQGSREWSCLLSKDQLLQQTELQKAHTFAYEPLISIVVPTYETKKEFLVELLDSVKQQTYEKWELLLADAGSSAGVKDVVSQETDSRIRYIKLAENKGIADNTNAGIAEAKGDYIALLDHDDVLTQDALYEMVERLNREEAPEKVLAVYSDEDKCDSRMEHFYEPHFKPDFNLDLLLSNNYICHFLMVCAMPMKTLLLRKEFDGAQDYDLVLRLAERKEPVLHVDKVLYHWRCHEASTADNTESKRYAYDAGRRALQDYYHRNGIEQAEVKDSVHLGFYQTVYEPDIFAVRTDVAAVCGRVVQKGVVVGGPVLGKQALFIGLKKRSSGYMHRASLRMDVDEADDRALQLRPGLEISLEEAMAQGMQLVYEPAFVTELG
jgi:glycosyltransferase involved in cell wall biosynthesis